MIEQAKYQSAALAYRMAKKQWKLDQRHYVKHFPEKYQEARKRYHKAKERWKAAKHAWENRNVPQDACELGSII